MAWLASYVYDVTQR